MPAEEPRLEADHKTVRIPIDADPRWRWWDNGMPLREILEHLGAETRDVENCVGWEPTGRKR